MLQFPHLALSAGGVSALGRHLGLAIHLDTSVFLALARYRVSRQPLQKRGEDAARRRRLGNLAYPSVRLSVVGPRRLDGPTGPSGVAKHWDASQHAALEHSLRTSAPRGRSVASSGEPTFSLRTVGSITVNLAASLRPIASQQCVSRVVSVRGRPLVSPTATPAPPSSVCWGDPAGSRCRLAAGASCYVNIPYLSWNGVLSETYAYRTV